LGAVLDLALLATVQHGQLGLQPGEPALDDAPVDLDLLFTRAAQAHAAGRAAGVGLAFEVRPQYAQARRRVLELGQLDLELGLAGAGAAGKDIEDELAAVEHPAAHDLLELANLRRAELVVEHNQVGLVAAHQLGDVL